MSAYIVTDNHVIGLAAWAARRRLFSHRIMSGDWAKVGEGYESEAYRASRYANCLLEENIRSVNARYGDGVGYVPVCVTERDLNVYMDCRPIDVIKSCDCLMYQSCESDDYEDSEAFKLLNSIRNHAVSSLPGWQEGPWGELPRKELL